MLFWAFFSFAKEHHHIKRIAYHFPGHVIYKKPSNNDIWLHIHVLNYIRILFNEMFFYSPEKIRWKSESNTTVYIFIKYPRNGSSSSKPTRRIPTKNISYERRDWKIHSILPLFPLPNIYWHRRILQIHPIESWARFDKSTGPPFLAHIAVIRNQYVCMWTDFGMRSLWKCTRISLEWENVCLFAGKKYGRKSPGCVLDFVRFECDYA